MEHKRPSMMILEWPRVLPGMLALLCARLGVTVTLMIQAVHKSDKTHCCQKRLGGFPLQQRGALRATAARERKRLVCSRNCRKRLMMSDCQGWKRWISAF